MFGRRRLSRLGAVFAAVALLLTFVAPSASAADWRNPPSRSHRIGFPSDPELYDSGFKYKFQPWDYDTGNRHVDNPVTLIFVSTHADMVDRVYGQVAWVGLTGSGSKMRLEGVGGSRSGVTAYDPWTSYSAGRKGAFGCWGQCGSTTDIHLRTYGPDGRLGTQVYEAGYTWPYYLIATVHFDVNEGTSSASFGYQDRARRYLYNEMKAFGFWRYIRSTWAHNSCYGWFDNSHYCDSTGYAWVVSIDG